LLIEIQVVNRGIKNKVDRIGEFSNHFISDLQSLAALSRNDNEEEPFESQSNIETKGMDSDLESNGSDTNTK
jgi:hypothetical protein